MGYGVLLSLRIPSMPGKFSRKYEIIWEKYQKGAVVILFPKSTFQLTTEVNS